MPFEIYTQAQVEADYKSLNYDYIATHQKYVTDNNEAGLRVLNSMKNHGDLPVKPVVDFTTPDPLVNNSVSEPKHSHVHPEGHGKPTVEEVLAKIKAGQL